MKSTISILAYMLLGLVCDAETITLEIVPTFHTPLIIEIKEKENQGTITVTRYSGQGGYDWGAIDLKHEKELDELDIKIIRKKIQEISFWEMPEKSGTIGLDGSIWALSVKNENKGHTVRRWSPQSDTNERDLEGFRDLGYFLSDICGIHPIYGKQIDSDQDGVRQ